jgi:hypothetical protein
MKLTFVSFVAAVLFFCCGRAVAQTWYGAASTDWNNRTNWTPTWDLPSNIQSVPASGAAIIISYPCNFYPIVTNNLTIGTLVINDGAGGSVTVAAGTLTSGAITVNQYCTFTVNAGAAVNASSGGITWVGGSTLNIFGTLNAGANALAVNGSATVSGGTLTSGAVTVNSGGSFLITNGTVTAGTLTMYNGNLTINAGAIATFSGGAATIDGGSLTINSGATATFPGGLLLNSSGAFSTLPGSTVNIPGPITGYGSCNITGGNFYLSGGTENVPAGTYTSLILSGSGTYSLASGTAVSGNLSIASGSMVGVASSVNISVGNLTLNGVTQVSGTWGYSGRSHNNTTYFANTTGYLTVANGPAASKLAFTSTAVTTAVGVASSSITVQRQDALGNANTTDVARLVTLASTSGGLVTFTPANPLTIASGSSTVSFTYADTAAGRPTITAASTSPNTITPATQTEKVVGTPAFCIFFTGPR